MIYEEIGENRFNTIYKKITEQGIEFLGDTVIGRIDYIGSYDIWKYTIFGDYDLEERVLLKGKDAESFHDCNYPEIYFCRQDILQSLGDLEAE